LAVERPRLDRRAWSDRPLDFAGFELDGQHPSARVGLRRLIGLGIQLLLGGGRLVHERTAMGVNVGGGSIGSAIVRGSMLG
jgi:hypothetical protein